MRSKSLIITLLIASFFGSCQLIGDIFKAGAYTGIIVVVVIIALIIWLFSRFTKKN